MIFPSVIAWLMTIRFLNYRRKKLVHILGHTLATSSTFSSENLSVLNSCSNNNTNDNSQANRNKKYFPITQIVFGSQTTPALASNEANEAQTRIQISTTPYNEAEKGRYDEYAEFPEIVFPAFILLFALEFAGLNLTAIFVSLAIVLLVVVLLVNYMRGHPKGSQYAGISPIAGLAGYTESVFEGIDYNLLFIFIGLFIISGAFVDTGIPRAVWNEVAGGSGAAFDSIQSTALVSIYVIVASQLVGNVPLVIMASNQLSILSENRQRFGWLLLAWVSTIAGNFTITGSAANIIVIEKAGRSTRAPIHITAIEHFRECGLITLLVIIMGILVIYLESKLLGYLY